MRSTFWQARSLRLCMAGVGLAFFGLGLWGLWQMRDFTTSQFLFGALLATPVIVFGGYVLVRTMVGPKAIISDRGVTLVGLLRTRRVRWEDITDVALVPTQTGVGPWRQPVIYLSSGDDIRAELPFLRSPSPAESLVDVIEQELQRR